MKRTRSILPRIVPLLRALGRHGVGCEWATEQLVCLSAHEQP